MLHQGNTCACLLPLFDKNSRSQALTLKPRDISTIVLCKRFLVFGIGGKKNVDLAVNSFFLYFRFKAGGGLLHRCFYLKKKVLGNRVSAPQSTAVLHICIDCV